MAVWIKGMKDKDGFEIFPYCSDCGYHWKEQVIGPVGEGVSDISEAHFCPNCGERMIGVEIYRKQK